MLPNLRILLFYQPVNLDIYEPTRFETCKIGWISKNYKLGTENLHSLVAHEGPTDNILIL